MTNKVIGRPFKKGESGNPGGRPKKDWTWASLIEEAVEEEYTTKDGLRTDKGKKFIAKKLVHMAIDGDIQAIKEISNRMDGLPAQSMDFTTGGQPFELPDILVQKIDQIYDKV